MASEATSDSGSRAAVAIGPLPVSVLGDPAKLTHILPPPVFASSITAITVFGCVATSPSDLDALCRTLQKSCPSVGTISWHALQSLAIDLIKPLFEDSSMRGSWANAEGQVRAAELALNFLKEQQYHLQPNNGRVGSALFRKTLENFKHVIRSVNVVSSDDERGRGIDDGACF